MATDTESQDYINEMAFKAGFVLDFHKVMAQHDVGVLTASNSLRSEIRSESHLDNKTQELLYIVGYTVAGFPSENLRWHVRAALAAGAAAEEILKAMEIIILVAGVVPFMRAVEAWSEVTGNQGIEPTVASVPTNNDGLPKVS